MNVYKTSVYILVNGDMCNGLSLYLPLIHSKFYPF